jgi:superfamily I DNA/RNA helicase
MNYSIYQTAIFSEIEHGNRSIIVNAVAGSGKTSTVVEACRRLPTGLNALFIAFNKAIVTELKERLPSGMNCITYNSCGWAAWRRYTGKKMLKLDANKSRNIIKNNFRYEDAETYGGFCNRLVALGKSEGLTPTSADSEWMDLAEKHGLQGDGHNFDFFRAIFLTKRVLEVSIETANVVCDFDDQIYMPWLKGAAMDKYDIVFIDEAQDTNTPQMELLARMLNPGGRIVAVGDPKQAIYGFRGAGTDSMERIKTMFNAVEMPLSISYRCAKNIVAEAQKFVSHIEAFDGAADGTVDTLVGYKGDTFRAKDAILCRKNAPLINHAYQLIARGVPINFLGRDIGQGLKALIKQMNVKTIEDLEIKLASWLQRESDKLIAKEQEDKIDALNDRVNCIEIFIANLNEDSRTIDLLIKSIDALFNASTERGITLSTMHKSKGREWDRVFILDWDLCPSSWAKRAWQRDQEINLQYVAVTRAKQHLTFISSKNWVDEAGF